MKKGWGKGSRRGEKSLKVVEPKRACQLCKYLGFDSVAASNPNGDNIEIEKMQCINHVQTRMGTRIRC